MNISAGDYWLLLKQSDVETKLIFIIFALMSLSCAVIVAMKLMSLQSKNRIARDVIKKLRKAQTIDDILHISAKYESTPIGTLVSQFLFVLKRISQDREKVTDAHLHQLQEVLDQTIDEIIFLEESYMPVISTSAAVAPLIGLFGTVSGLIHSFMQIAKLQAADIAAVAPGIAEALITTWGGLIIAIAFLALHHIVYGSIRNFDHQLERISNKLMWFARSVLEI